MLHEIASVRSSEVISEPLRAASAIHKIISASEFRLHVLGTETQHAELDAPASGIGEWRALQLIIRQQNMKQTNSSASSMEAKRSNRKGTTANA